MPPAEPHPTEHLPFAIDPTAAERRTRDWIAREAAGAELAHFRARYVPFFLFDASAEGSYRGAPRVRRTVTRVLRGLRTPSGYALEQRGTEESFAASRSGEVRLPRETLHVPAVRDLPNRAVAALHFGAFGELRPLPAEDELGIDVQRVTRGVEEAREIAETALLARLQTAAEKALGGREPRLDELQPRFAIERERLVLLPVYAGTLRREGREHGIALDGRSGVVACDLPDAERRRGHFPLRWLALAFGLLLTAVELTVVQGLELDDLLAIGVVLASLGLSFAEFLYLHTRLAWPLLAIALLGLATLELALLQALGASAGLLFALGAVLFVLLALLLIASFPSRERR
ncbi:MAG: hypothetical protein IPN34_15930 [Planctomycetes bacterium]|nr:hypothetical protein [Planctomycetota bacterium]